MDSNVPVIQMHFLAGRFEIQNSSVESKKLSELYTQVFPEKPLPHWNQNLLRTWVFYLESSDSPIGFVLCQCIDPEWEILDFGVLPLFQNQGLGKAFLNQFLKLADQSKIQKVYLEVSDQNKAARRIYESCGFYLDGKRSRYYGDGSDACLMSWEKT